MTLAPPRKLALITGASAGIGEAFAHAYAAKGYDLILVARRLERLDILGQALTQTHGIKTSSLPCDLSRRDAVDIIGHELAALNAQPDVLINNAGYSYLDASWADQADFIQVLVTTPAGLCRLVLPGMISNGWGRIINVSSITAFSPGAAGHTLYPAAKSFIIKMSQSLAAEVKHEGVNVTAICPGQTRSEFTDANGTRGLVARSGMWTQSAESVVDTAIRGNEAGREVVISGWHNKLSVIAMKLLPDTLTASIIRPIARKFVIAPPHKKIEDLPEE